MDIKRRNGEYIGAFAAYGYLKDEENKNHLVVDEYAADVVRDIFSMKLCGMSQQAIADKLNADGILSPIQYKKSIGVGLNSSFQKSLKPKWSYNAVLRILKNEVYTGTVVQGKCTTPNYKIKKRIHKDETKWIRVEDMHEAIIPKSDFDIVQDILLRDTRVAPEQAEVFPLAGMVFCADCGEPMVRKTVPAGGKRYVYYVCSGNKRDKSKCSTHNISEKNLIQGVLGVVQDHIGKVIATADAIEMIHQTQKTKPDVVKLEDRIQKLSEEADACNSRKMNLYEDYKDGILSKDEYSMLKEKYQAQMDDIEKSIASIEADRDGILANGTGRQEWIDKLKKYNGATELDRELVTFLIDKIEVVDPETILVTYRFETALKEMERVLELYSGQMKEAV